MSLESVADLRLTYTNGKLSIYAKGQMLAEEQDARLLRLTFRQRQVAKLWVEGKQAGEIALALGVEESTVRDHIRAIYNLLEVNDRLAGC